MICPECRNKTHTKCRGGTWCACQHRPQVPEPATDADYAALAASRDEEDEAFDAAVRRRPRDHSGLAEDGYYAVGEVE